MKNDITITKEEIKALRFCFGNLPKSNESNYLIFKKFIEKQKYDISDINPAGQIEIILNNCDSYFKDFGNKHDFISEIKNKFIISSDAEERLMELFYLYKKLK